MTSIKSKWRVAADKKPKKVRRCNVPELKIVFTIELYWFSAEMFWDSSPGTEQIHVMLRTQLVWSWLLRKELFNSNALLNVK